jgi:hypothetical protein
MVTCGEQNLLTYLGRLILLISIFLISNIPHCQKHTNEIQIGKNSLLFLSLSGLALFWVESFEIYLVLRALLGITSVSVTYSGLILAIEYVDGIWRTVAGMYNLFPLPLSYIMISGIAYLTQDYKNLQLCIGLPGVFLCLLW